MRRLVTAAVVVAGVLFGACGQARAVTSHPHRLHMTAIWTKSLPSPGCPSGCASVPSASGTPTIPPATSDVQPIGDCEQAAMYIAANGAPGEAVVCPYYGPLPSGKVSTTLGHTIYIKDTNCAAAYEDEAWNSHGWSDQTGFTPYRGVIDPYGPCYVG